MLKRDNELNMKEYGVDIGGIVQNVIIIRFIRVIVKKLVYAWNVMMVVKLVMTLVMKIQTIQVMKNNNIKHNVLV